MSATVLVHPTAFDAALSLALGMRHRPLLAHSEPVFRAFLTESVLAGLLMLGAAACLRFRSAFLALASRRPLRVGTAIAIAASLQALVLWRTRSAVLDGARVWFLDDDAMISMRYAANLAAGEGLVWNAGERVEGYSNFLWTCLMAVVHGVGIGRDTASLFVLLTNVVLTCALLVQVDRLATALRLPALLCTLALLLTTLSREMLKWSSSGLETTALALLCALAFARLAMGQTRRIDKGLLTAVALLPLVRADAILLAVLIVAAAVAVRRSRREIACLVTAALLPFAFHLGFRIFYYGDWLPNTAHLKVASTGRWRTGVEYLLQFARWHGAVLVFAAIGLRSLPRSLAAPFAGLLSAYFFYVLYIGGDAFEGARLLVPVLPLLFVLALLGTTMPGRSAAWRRAAVAAVCLTTALLFPNRYLPLLPTLIPALGPSYADVGNVALGKWLHAHTPPDATVGDYWAGTVFYFSGRRGIDFLGKMDGVIARMPPACDSGPPGHDKFDFAHSLGVLKPDYVVAGFKLMPDGTAMGPSGERMPEGDRSTCRVFAALLESPEFRASYLPHIASNEGWRTVFRRISSPRQSE